MAKKMLGKARSFRLSPRGEESLNNLMEHWKLDNENKTLNYALENVWEVLRDKPALDHLKELFKLLDRSGN